MWCKYCGKKTDGLIIITAPSAEWGYAFCSDGCAYKFLGMMME